MRKIKATGDGQVAQKERHSSDRNQPGHCLRL